MIIPVDFHDNSCWLFCSSSLLVIKTWEYQCIVCKNFFKFMLYKHNYMHGTSKGAFYLFLYILDTNGHHFIAWKNQLVYNSHTSPITLVLSQEHAIPKPGMFPPPILLFSVHGLFAVFPEYDKSLCWLISSSGGQHLFLIVFPALFLVVFWLKEIIVNNSICLSRVLQYS